MFDFLFKLPRLSISHTHVKCYQQRNIFVYFEENVCLERWTNLTFRVALKLFSFFGSRRKFGSLTKQTYVLYSAMVENPTGLSCHLPCIYFPSGLKAAAVGDVNLASRRLGDGAA